MQGAASRPGKCIRSEWWIFSLLRDPWHLLLRLSKGQKAPAVLGAAQVHRRNPFPCTLG